MNPYYPSMPDCYARPQNIHVKPGRPSALTTGCPRTLAHRVPARIRGTIRAVVRLGSFVGASVLLALALILAPVSASARALAPAQVAFGVVVSYGPPVLPVYAQPICPGPGYLWTPGFWAWDPLFGYYWVPGTWVLTPFPGGLWTPGYWAWVDADDGFVWYEGYWGPVVGFYGGIDYGYGYPGYGYYGGYWNRGAFYYNTSVNRINTTTITTVYDRTVVNNVNVTRVSYNGGRGGITARPNAEQLAAAGERRSGPISVQVRQQSAARSNPQQRASMNHGWPEVAATPSPGAFRGRDVVQAVKRGGAFSPPPENNDRRPFAGEANPVRNQKRPSITTPSRPAPSPTPSAEPSRSLGRPHGAAPEPRESRPPVMGQPQEPRPAMTPRPEPPHGPPHPQGPPQKDSGHGKPGHPPHQ